MSGHPLTIACEDITILCIICETYVKEEGERKRGERRREWRRKKERRREGKSKERRQYMQLGKEARQERSERAGRGRGV